MIEIADKVLQIVCFIFIDARYSLMPFIQVTYFYLYTNTCNNNIYMYHTKHVLCSARRRFPDSLWSNRGLSWLRGYEVWRGRHIVCITRSADFFDRSTQVGSFLVSVIILSMNLSIQDYFFLIYTDHGVLLKIQIFNIILYSFSLTKLSLFPFYTTIPPKILLLLSQYLCEKSSPCECNDLV